MTKLRVDCSVKNQIELINGQLKEAMKKFREKESNGPFEYVYYGPLYPKTIQYYRRRGYILSWKSSTNDSDPSYWSFKVPDLDINLDNLR